MQLPIKIGKETYPALTGIRAVSAILVFFEHFTPVEGWYLNISAMPFFFVLSGFLIIRVYYDQAQLTRGWLSRYFINRFARIYPVYFLLLTLVVFLKHDFQPWLLIRNYTLIHALFHDSGSFLIEASWSLTVEECFYFLAPLIMILIRLYNFFVPLALAVLMLSLALLVSKTGITFLGTPIFVFSTTFFGHFLEFFAGVYLALVIMRRETQQLAQPRQETYNPAHPWQEESQQGIHRLAQPQQKTRELEQPPREEPQQTHRPGELPQGRRNGIKWTLCGLLGILVLKIPLDNIYGHIPMDHASIILINNFLMPFPILLLYFGLITENNILARILSGKAFGLLGRSSYSFYLLHILVIMYIGKPLLFQLFGGARFPTVMLTFVLTYLLSIGLFLFYEQPLNLFIRKKFIAAGSAPPSQ
ncbi:MAG TPA: acyltransferase [Puia sp.]|nr:acyltransferase [Puia sp.]